RFLLENGAEEPQHLVTGEVTEAVVVELEVVEVEDDGDQSAAAARGGELAGELALELASVGQAGERIRERERAHLLEEAGVLDGDRGLVGERPEQLELVLVEGLLAGAGEEHAERAAAVEQWCGGDRRVAEEVPALGLDERLLRRVNGRAWSAVADHPAGEAPFDREQDAEHVARQSVRPKPLEPRAVVRHPPPA